MSKAATSSILGFVQQIKLMNNGKNNQLEKNQADEKK
jgi:hypothetical protein